MSCSVKSNMNLYSENREFLQSHCEVVFEERDKKLEKYKTTSLIMLCYKFELDIQPKQKVITSYVVLSQIEYEFV